MNRRSFFTTLLLPSVLPFILKKHTTSSLLKRFWSKQKIEIEPYTERLCIRSKDNVGLVFSNPTAILHINQDSWAGTINPKIRLEIKES